MANKTQNIKRKWIQYGLILAPVAIGLYFYESIKEWVQVRTEPKQTPGVSPNQQVIYGADYRGKQTRKTINKSVKSKYLGNKQVVDGYRWFATPNSRNVFLTRIGKA